MNRNLMLVAGLGAAIALAILIWFLMGGKEEAGEPLSSTQVVEEPAQAEAPASETPGASEEQAAEQQAEGETQSEAGTQPDAAGTEEAAQSAALPSEQPVAGTQAPSEPSLVAPSFDVVRVEPSGDTVIAGRAMPGSTVTIIDNGVTLGSATADARGEWVFLPDSALSSGDHELSLEADHEGSTLLSENVVVVLVPEPEVQVAAPETQEGQTAEQAPSAGEAVTEGPAPAVQEPLAVLTSRDGSGGGTQILQAPGSDTPPQDLILEAVDYDAEGHITVSGRGAAGDRVLLYLDNAPIGQTAVSGSGHWTLRAEDPVAYGLYKLRADQIGSGGSVVARVETVFSRVEMQLADLPQDQFVVVEPGNSLWVIARRLLGSGLRYSVIFEANNDQIRDPDLIYPGQIFLVPQLPQAGNG